MSDDHNDLKHLLVNAPPPPAGASARDRNIDAAMAAFDAQEKISTEHQGSTNQARPTIRQHRLTAMWRRLMNISFPSTRTLMMGGASLAVLTLAVMVTHDQLPQPKTSTSGGGILGLSSPDATPTGQRNKTDAIDEAEAVAPAQPRTEARSDRADAPTASGNLGAQIAPTEEQAGQSFMLQDKSQMRELSAAQKGAAELSSRERKAVPQIAIAPSPAPADLSQSTYQDQGRDRFEDFEANQIKRTAEEPVSTFSVDVDTASYSFMRSALMNGVLPQKDAIRVEELINYFPYDYAGPETRETPFATNVSVMATPWDANTRLMRIGIKGYELAPAEKPRSNLVFLLDTSGSMNNPNKLPLLINSFKLMVDSLDPDDTVSIVVYAGSAGTVLEPTKVSEKSKIISSLERLRAGGSTAGGEGIRQAYRLAEENFDKDGINRVILATDGDFNVGITNPEELQDFVERKRETGVFLSVLGFGRGNYNDQLMQTLAQNGNGNAAYIDTLSEARKTLVEESASTLFPIAKDVKIQVEFNPATVSEYRLIGYETRILNREDFNNDKIDAAEIGAGHTVTALYEITPVGSPSEQIDSLRYQSAESAAAPVAAEDEYAFVKIRYKDPDADTSKLLTYPVTASDEGPGNTEAKFAASVAAFGQLLRGGRHTDSFGYDDVIDLAVSAKGADPFGYRAEFVNLVRLAKTAAAQEPQRR